jgi:hypothetical protein
MAVPAPDLAALLAGGIGIIIYFVGLTYGGWLQGLAMLDASNPSWSRWR